MSSPVKRSTFDAAIAHTPVDSLSEVVLATHSYRHPDDFFRAVGVPMPGDVTSDGFCALARATWTGLDGPPPPHTASVSFYAVPANQRAPFSTLMQRHGIPRLLTWIRALEIGPQTQRDGLHRLALYWNQGTLAHAET